MKEIWRKIIVWIDSKEEAADEALRGAAERQYSARIVAVVFLVVFLVGVILLVKACTT